MILLYIYILFHAACVGFISAVPHITVSAPVGSTVVLPCKLTHVFTQTSVIRWRADEIVFERSSSGTYVGEGYERRVDVPEDELHKRNCSLVLKDVRLTDDDFYRTFVVEHVDRTNTDKEQELYSVTVSVNGFQISAAVGSTVVLPCEWRDLSIQTPHVEWYIDREVVFERQGKETFQGEGYEGRVDVPEDELHKGNCSLVLKNVSVSDEGVYRSSMYMVKHKKKPVLIQKVQLSVSDLTEERSASSDKIEESSDKNSVSTVRASGDSVMIWGRFSRSGRDSATLCGNKMKSHDHLNVLNHQHITSMDFFLPDDTGHVPGLRV